MVFVAVAIVAARARAQDQPSATPSVAAPLGGPGAPRPVDVEVERHAVLGQRLLERGQPQEAIAEFRRAYELRADARFLYEIGEGYRRLGLRDQALFFFEHYLSAAPDAPDREDVEEQIAALRRPPPTTTATPSAGAPSLAGDITVVPAPARPPWRRWWSWTALGVVLAGTLVTALVLGREPTSPPATALGDKKFY
jgi:tetratricopeptide (TPR) repeat protein